MSRQMSTAMMSAPSLAIAIACARPWPRAAPVMNATLPSSLPAISCSLLCAGSADRCERDVQFRQAAHDERRLVCVAAVLGRAVALLGDRDVGHPVENPVQRNATLCPRQRCAGAGVHTADKRDLLAYVRSVRVE